MGKSQTAQLGACLQRLNFIRKLMVTKGISDNVEVIRSLRILAINEMELTLE